MYLIYNGKIRVYNNTVYNCDLGYEVSPNVQLINNIAQNCDNGYANSWAFWNYTNYNNLSDLSGDAPGVDAINDATVDFVNETSDDFHLSINDLTARNRGVDLSSDSTLAFSDDVDGDIRLDGSWDIGADESPTKIYRSVGPSNTSALDDDNSHADTVSVSSGVATFSSDLPDNVGVGDAVLIDTGGTDQTIDSSDTLLFIHGRTNPTTYILRDEAGSAPSDISSNDTYEIYRAYTSLSLAEAGTKNTSIPSTFTGGNRDLVTNNEQWNIACYGDAVDTGGFTVGGWTTSSSNNIKIYTPVSSSEVGTSQRHTGLWDASSGYSISYESTGNYQSTIRIYEKHVTVDGLQISISNPSNYTHSTCITTDYITNPALISIKNSILKGVTAGETNTIGVKTGDSGAGEAHEVRISNNVIYDLAYGIYFAESGEKYIYNNTIYNCSTFGIDGGSAVVAKNNITQNCTDGFLGTFDGASDYNISDVSGDTTGISTSYRNGLVTDVIFFDEANDDFHLSVTDTSARNQGTDLSSDSNLPFWTDIDGETRAYGAAWDIGADEFTKATTLFKGGVNVTGGTRITN